MSHKFAPVMQYLKTSALFDRERRSIQMFIMRYIMHSATAQFIQGPAEYLFCRRIHRDDSPFAVHRIETFAHVAHDGFIERSRLAQFFLRAFTLGDIDPKGNI